MTNLSVASTRHQMTVQLEVEGAEPRPVEYTRTGATYRPDVLVLEFARRDRGPWTVESVSLAGRKLKKDGTDSTNRAKERFWLRDEKPQWVTDAIEQYQPTLTDA